MMYTEVMIMPTIINTPSIPIPIYLRFSINLIGSKYIAFYLLDYEKNPSTSEPAITDAI